MSGCRLVFFSLLAMPLGGLTAPFARGDSPVPPRPAALRSTLFDPARHMHVSEVRPGMTGYGLSVFHGAKIERFDVEVVSVLKNFNARSDVVLIRCKGDYLEHTGSIAGMSGSPIFLTDAAGHDRMIGAFAYGWPLTKDPVAGVQPIEYMLQLPMDETAAAQSGASGASRAIADRSGGMHRSAWSMNDAGMLPLAWRGFHDRPADSAKPGASALLGDGRAVRIEPLATPLMTSGMSTALFDRLNARFRAAGLTPLQAGVGGSSGANAGAADIRLEPGSVLAVPLLTGDLEMTAIGTVTEVLGNRVWGFGHPFNNEGPISLPMGSGEINGVIANLQTSFKLGSMSQARGTLSVDGSVGVGGITGASPQTASIELSVQAADGSPEKTYHFAASRHAKFTPLIAASAFAAAAAGSSELPQFNTVDYDMQLAFDNGQTVRLVNRAVNSTSQDLFGDAAVVMQAASDNPFQRVLLKKAVGSVTVRPIAHAAQITDVNLPKSKYHPGDKIRAFVAYQPFHGDQAVTAVEMDLPRELPHGQYQLVISDAVRYFADEQQSRPFRFVAENVDDVFSILKDVAGIRENALYMRLMRTPDGVAIGHTALPHLPASRRDILLAAGSSNMTPFISSRVRIIPTELVMAGSAEFTIDVEPTSKVAGGAPLGARPEVESPAPAKPETPKKSQGSSDVPGKSEAPKDAKPAD